MKTVDIPPCQLFSLGLNDFVEIYKEQVPSNRRRRGPHTVAITPLHAPASQIRIVVASPSLSVSLSLTHNFFFLFSPPSHLSQSLSHRPFSLWVKYTRHKIKHKHMSHSGSFARVTAKTTGVDHQCGGSRVCRRKVSGGGMSSSRACLGTQIFRSLRAESQKIAV
jgi:hypothetical protein